MPEATYRVAVYASRIQINLPKSIGPVDLAAQCCEGGVLVRIKASPHGKYSGSGIGDRWCYTFRPPEGVKFPRFGATPAELRKGLTEDGVMELWAPAGRAVEQRVRGPNKPPAVREAVAHVQQHNAMLQLGDLVRQINNHKQTLGDALVLEISSEGRLRALVEYG